MSTPTSTTSSNSPVPTEGVVIVPSSKISIPLSRHALSAKHFSADSLESLTIAKSLVWSHDGGVLLDCPEQLYCLDTKHGWPYIRPVTDGRTFQQYYISKLLLPPETRFADGFASPWSSSYSPTVSSVPIMEGQVRLYKTPSTVFFFVPGNPGVASAYLPWLYYLLSLLGDDALIVFSGHLGHLKTSDPGEAFTCAQNIEHQQNMLRLMLDDLRVNGQLPINLLVAGHSAGGHFSHRGLWGLWKLGEPYKTYIEECGRYIFLCPTLVGFAPTGKLKAIIAASNPGQRLCLKLRQSKWFEARTNLSPFHRNVANEFSESFIAHMSSLTRDELEHLPNDLDTEISVCDEMSIPTYFMLAANDAYVPKATQRRFLDHFGASKVYISQDWWHAFCLHEQGFLESAAIAAAIVTCHAIPRDRQLHMRHASTMRWDSISFDARVGVSRLVVGAISVASVIQKLVARPFANLMESSKKQEIAPVIRAGTSSRPGCQELAINEEDNRVSKTSAKCCT